MKSKLKLVPASDNGQDQVLCLPLRSDSVTTPILLDPARSLCAIVRETVSVPDPVGPNSLPLEWILSPKGISLSELARIRHQESIEFLCERVLARLQYSEAKEPEDSRKSDIRIAWHIVLHCLRGDAVECSPAVLAWYEVVGCHPDQFYDRLMIRRAYMLGSVNVLPFPKSTRKKSAQSVQEKKVAKCR